MKSLRKVLTGREDYDDEESHMLGDVSDFNAKLLSLRNQIYFVG